MNQINCSQLPTYLIKLPAQPHTLRVITIGYEWNGILVICDEPECGIKLRSKST